MMNFTRIKKLFVYGLIGSLIVSALIAVITVLFGEFNDTVTKVFLTLLMVVVHLAIGLAFVWGGERQGAVNKLAFFTNVMFILLVVSFLTSIFGTWEIISGNDIVLHLYQTYFIIGFASLYGNVLSRAVGKEKYINMIVYANYLFLAAIVLMFQPLIYVNNASTVLGEMYFRIFGAVGIIDGTLSILAVIFYKLYMHKHPELTMPVDGQATQGMNRGLRTFIWVIVVVVVVPVVISVALALFSRFSRF